MRQDEPPRHTILTWADIEALIDRLLPQMTGVFDALVLVTRGGIVPGGMIAEALDIKHILTAAVEFPSGNAPALLAWPTFCSSQMRRWCATNASSSWMMCGHMGGTL